MEAKHVEVGSEFGFLLSAVVAATSRKAWLSPVSLPFSWLAVVLLSYQVDSITP